MYSVKKNVALILQPAYCLVVHEIWEAWHSAQPLESDRILFHLFSNFRSLFYRTG
jgi:hypothetical protein